MRNRRTAVLLALITGLAALAPSAYAEEGAAESAGSPNSAAHMPGAAMRLSAVRPQENTTDTTTLHCRPAGGSHPDPAAACAALDRAGGDFDALGETSPQTTMCTMQYAPVRVRASGVWQGRTVDYTETFSNACVAAAETAGVFDFEPR
ncbi:SSI family serine proteinase inhibitor [Streptomonospora wellingtoniae]|uniref:SSI family serine proteinase inhibitor n=1 Tax=Streptomonospora wellingtoniae TaxID=3075544 RepID=A0ABU2L166_9ACTN|nr:SSI family serine proteinase inhibitor [Streptomonospora sp. DSM 45055]MDT0305122.1 SSI family serine proteinase inhibitor [Streptomonospora sp. DSM 45055]